MANATAARIGADNQGADKRALFLKVYGGMVLTAFRRRTAFRSRHLVRTLSSGKSAQFPATGGVTASYHTPGEELLGQQINDSERVITIDDILVSDLFLAEIDELISHFEVRSEYAYQQGEELANFYDKNVARMAILAARASATVTGGNGGTEIVDADADTSADSLAGSIFDVAQAFDEKNVPDSNRWVFVTPAQYYLMVESSSKAIHKDYGGEGSYAGGSIIRVAGIPIVKTNNLPQSDDSANGNLKAKYQANYSTTVALAMHRSAVGTVQLQNLTARMDYDPRRLGTLLVAKYLLGHGILRPESAAEIKTA